MSEIIHITDADYKDKAVKEGVSAVIDFWATWCGPCQMMSPIVDEIAAEREDIKVGKVNVDEQRALTEKFGIMNIPTLLVFKNGSAAGRIVGFKPKEEILAQL